MSSVGPKTMSHTTCTCCTPAQHASARMIPLPSSTIIALPFGHAIERFGHNPDMPIAKPRAYLPNWAVATILTGFVGGTYWYSMRAVGSDDLEKELARESDRQRRRQEGEQ